MAWFLWVLWIGFAQPAPYPDQASNSQKLVPPSAYHNIPAGVRVALQQHGCRLPEGQTSDGEPINVISGHFASRKQNDWAALCVIGDQAEVFVSWGGKARACPAEIHSGWPLQGKFSAEPAGGLFLRKASPQLILRYRQQFPTGPAPPVTHEGLEVGDEQASLVYYCDAGKWVELRGND